MRLILLVAALVTSASPSSADEQLAIQPVYQQTPVWCWAAVGEMVLRHFGYPNLNPAGNYQCGFVGSLGGICSANCGACVSSIGSTWDLANALLNYQIAADLFAPSSALPFSVHLTSALPPDEIVARIDQDLPVLAGISPSGNGWYYPDGLSEHVTLIVGYGDDGEVLVVNDPMPYMLTPFDPYLAAGGHLLLEGQYLVSYDAFVDLLGYKDSILVE